MSDPRIFQGWPLTEVPMAELALRYETSRIKREKAAEVAPGIFVQVESHGDYSMPDGKITSGARLAVWDERLPIMPQLQELVAELHSLADHYHDERGKLDSAEDEGAVRRVQARAAYLSGLEFAFGDAAHKLSKLLRVQKRMGERAAEEARPERQDLSWLPGFGPEEGS